MSAKCPHCGESLDGPVAGGHRYYVGEKGPEFFIPPLQIDGRALYESVRMYGLRRSRRLRIWRLIISFYWRERRPKDEAVA